MCVRTRVRVCVCALMRACISELGLRGARAESVYVRLSSLVCVLVRENVLCVYDIRVRVTACVRVCLSARVVACVFARASARGCLCARAGVRVRRFNRV